MTEEEKSGPTVKEEDEQEDFEDDDFVEDEGEEVLALANLSMNMKNTSVNFGNQSSIDVAESSVDNLCKEAAELIASIPTPTKVTN